MCRGDEQHHDHDEAEDIDVSPNKRKVSVSSEIVCSDVATRTRPLTSRCPLPAFTEYGQSGSLA